MRRILTFLVVPLVLTVSTGFAQNAKESTAKKRDDARPSKRKVVIPRRLRQLNLSEKQQNKLRQVISKHDRRSEKLWRQFNAEHWDAVQLEASYLAAETLSSREYQEKNRRATRGKTTKETTRKSRKTQKQRKRRTSGFREGDQKNGVEVLAMRILVAGPEGNVKEFQLTRPRKKGEKGGTVYAGQRKRLAKQWNEVREIHRKIVKNEAEKMIAIEAVLTPQQHKKLFGGKKKQAKSTTNKR